MVLGRAGLPPALGRGVAVLARWGDGGEGSLLRLRSSLSPFATAPDPAGAD
jgi:hypothetical protein